MEDERERTMLSLAMMFPLLSRTDGLSHSHSPIRKERETSNGRKEGAKRDGWLFASESEGCHCRNLGVIAAYGMYATDVQITASSAHSIDRPSLAKRGGICPGPILPSHQF